MPSPARLDPDVVRGLARSAYVQQESGIGRVQPHEDYQNRPLGWIVEKLGVRRETLVWSSNAGYEDHQWDGDRDPFVRALEALADWKNVGIESGTGTGKTFVCACIVFWFLACWRDSIVVTAAPKEDQLLDKVWKEIERLWPRFESHFPQATLMASGEIRMLGDGVSRTWKAKAEVTGVREGEKVATKAQGEHAEHMLIITEETPGIHSAVMEAFENTRTAPHNLQVSVGNPDHQEDPLHRFCGEQGTASFRISALDHPNVVTGDHTIVPGAVSRDAIERRAVKYEHMPALYNSRVRGISPEQAFGIVLRNFDDSVHLEGNSRRAFKVMISSQNWPVWAAVDMGDWRNAFVVGAVDRAGRMRIIDEHFWHRVETDAMAVKMDEMLSYFGAEPRRTQIIADRKDAHSVQELKAALKRCGSEYSVRPVIPEHKARAASVRRLIDLLGRQKILFRRDLGADLEWRKGMSISDQGEPREGSRLLWEIKNWRYPEPREGQAQKQDPDDNSADGADAIAALRYLVLSWWKAADYELPDEGDNPNRDLGLERRMKQLNAERERSRRGWWWHGGNRGLRKAARGS